MKKSLGLLGTACLILSLSGNASLDTSSDVGRRDYNIEVAGGIDPATFIPVTEIRGSKPGPRLFVATGVHGYEFAPILAAEKLAEAIDPKQLSGIVLVTRPSHVSAFEARSPYVNPYDRKNLNRSFLGDPSGTQTERIAHIIST